MYETLTDAYNQFNKLDRMFKSLESRKKDMEGPKPVIDSTFEGKIFDGLVEECAKKKELQSSLSR